MESLKPFKSKSGFSKHRSSHKESLESLIGEHNRKDYVDTLRCWHVFTCIFSFQDKAIVYKITPFFLELNMNCAHLC